MKNIIALLITSISSIGFPAQAQRLDPFTGVFVSENTAGISIKYNPIYNATDIAYQYIMMHVSDLGLSLEDVEGMAVKDLYTDTRTGITRVYFIQRYKGIEVYNAILNISIGKNGKVFFTGNRFEKDIARKINTTDPKISSGDAVSSLSRHLGLASNDFHMKERASDSQFIFDKGELASEDIPVQLIYQPHQGKLRLAWDVLLSPLHKSDKWSSRVDAITGDVLDEYNWTVYCSPLRMERHEEGNSCYEVIPSFDACNITGQSEPVYNVWPAPIESPNHGPRILTTAPKDSLASPFGWHDTNGHPGPEYTITQGNNAHAFQDREGFEQSSGDEPSGGPDMVFDFPFDPSLEPDQSVDAAVVNLFYWINYMHDFTYHFGFDEAAGNFQHNNYGRGGIGNDALKLMAQQSADLGIFNNAYYKHSVEGSPSSIRMHLFRTSKYFLTVDEPSIVAGLFKTSFPSNGWGAGAYVSNIPVSGEVVMVNDGIDEPYTSDACETIINASDLAGKIALVERGGCEFGWKALQAQNAGAIAILVFNIDDEEYTMNTGTYGASIQIPILMIGLSDSQTLRGYVGNGLKVTFVDPGLDSTVARDSDFDNGLVAHEFGHGITSRLVGGPSTVCLSNPEQMDEGWSDFFAFVTTVLPGDTGEKRRGIGSYSTGDIPEGKGLRRQPYSTDMSIMPLTYKDVSSNPEEHNVGEVWGAALWDMYWAFVEQYGWSENAFFESSGNYRAIRLVVEGLKNTPCSPGFVDGRDAILAADESLYNGEHVCMLWEIFARRGIGYSADQGSPWDAGDQQEAFDLPPICTGKILIEKSVTDFIQPGEDIEVTITVGNYKQEPVTNAVVIDIIPDGTSFKINSSNLPVHIQGNTVEFNLGEMEFQEEIIITYFLETDPDAWSQRRFLDDISDENNINWLTYTMGDAATNSWTITDDYPAHTGSFTWNSKEIPNKSRQVLELKPEAFVFQVDGERPTLRFYHHYNTKASISGGIVEVKEANTDDWVQVQDNMLRNGYFGLIDYLSFVSPDIEAFSGNSGNTFKDTYVDLSPWIGKDILVRFRFGTSIKSTIGSGWFIDDIEFMNLLSYNSEVCVTSDQGDNECAIAPEQGSIVDSREDPLSSTDKLNTIEGHLYPNPATDMFHIAWPDQQQLNGNITIRAIDGKEIFTKTINAGDQGSLTVNTANIPAGIYIVDARTNAGRFVGKVIVQK